MGLISYSQSHSYREVHETFKRVPGYKNYEDPNIRKHEQWLQNMLPNALW